MILIVSLLVAATVGVATCWLAPRMGRGRVIYELAPDRPHAFGYDMSWLAVRSQNTEAVIDAMGLVGETAANWNSGIGTVYDNRLGSERIFISPPVDGWTFVVSLALPHPVGANYVDKCSPLLASLAAQFSDVQYYFCYPALDFFAWVRFRDGRLTRAFASTDQGLVWSKGKPTREEQALGLRLFELRGVKGRSGDTGGEILLSPTEDQVMQVAKAWSLDPTRLGAGDAPSALGYIVPAPLSWRTERVRKSAA